MAGMKRQEDKGGEGGDLEEAERGDGVESEGDGSVGGGAGCMVLGRRVGDALYTV